MMGSMYNDEGMGSTGSQHENCVEFNLGGESPLPSVSNSPVSSPVNKLKNNESTLSLDGDIARDLFKKERNTLVPTVHLPVPVVDPSKKHKGKKGKESAPPIQEQAEDEDGWQDMGTANDDVVFGEKGEVVVDTQDNEAVHASAEAYGYTRIAAEEEAKMYHESDKKTNFLFKASSPKRSAAVVQDRNAEKDTLNGDDDDDDDDVSSIDELYDVHREDHTAIDQLKTTKKLLTDAEKLAYLGLVKLVMNEMATQLATWGALKYCHSARSKFAKRMITAQTMMGTWSKTMLERLYAHLDVSEEEAKMLDNLVRHGIEPLDLSRSLKGTSWIDNPSYVKSSKSQENVLDKTFDENDDGVIRPEDISGNDKLEINVTWTAICDLFLVLVADSIYDARSRTLLINFARYLDVEPTDIYQFERRITDALQLEDASDQVWDEKDILKDRRRRQRRKKYMYVGLATVGGSLVLGLSAGLLAPVIGAGFAAGLATIGISGTSGFLAGAGGTALVTIGGTAIGARVGSSGMLKRVADVKTFEFVPLHNNKRTNLIITVSGWMNSKADDIRLPFSTVDPVMGDLFSLLWDPEILQSTGQTMTILASEALTQSIQQILGVTVLMALMSAIQIPMMLSKLSYLIDNPWNVSLDRAWKAGLILADTLVSRNLGVRPVTLLGFSLGSRVIYSCLLELAKRGAHGLVENVLLFGSPVVGSDEQLLLARSVVSGRFVNGYSKKDWILGYLFRATSGGLGRVMGLSQIENIDGIENFDCTTFVSGHMGYRTSMPKLLKELGIGVLKDEFVEIDDPDPETTERQRKLVLEFDEMRKQIEKEQATGGHSKKKGIFSKWFKPKTKKEWWQSYIDAKIQSDDKLAQDSDGEMDVVDQIAYIQRHTEGTVNEEEDLAERDDLQDEITADSLSVTDSAKPELTTTNTVHSREKTETGKSEQHTATTSSSEVNLHETTSTGSSKVPDNTDKPRSTALADLDDDDLTGTSENITMTFG